MNELKVQIRKQIKKTREEMAPDDVKRKSEAICDYIIASREFAAAGTVLLYSAIGCEVSLDRLIDYSLKCGKSVLLPVCRGNASMEAYRIESRKQLNGGMYGILEPDTEKCEPVRADGIDYIAVPAVAFDRHLNRIGRGAGYYDNYLPRAVNAFKMGVGYEFQILNELPTYKGDYKVDAITCETGILRGDGK